MTDQDNVMTDGYTPTSDELAARNRRNIAIGIGLALFMVFVFFTMLLRAGAI